jgi:hypothetical protein
MTIAKAALAGAGIIVWFLGMRMENPALRWTGTGLLAVAILLRFARPRA